MAFSTLKESTFVIGTAIYLASNVLTAIVPFVLLPVLTRYLEPGQYGEVAMFQTLLGALASVIGLSVHASAGRKFYDGNLGERELKEFIGSCIQILVATSAIALTVLVGFSGTLSEWIGLGPEWIFLAVFVTAFGMIVKIRLAQWQVRKKAINYGALQISQGALDLALSLLLVVVLLQGATGRISSQAIAAVSLASIALWSLKRDRLLTFCVWRPAYLMEAVKFGLPLIPHISGMFLIMSFDRFVINSQLGIAEAGIYMVAVQFGMALRLLFDAVNNAYVPWLYERLKRDDKEEKMQIVRYTYAWYLILLFGAGIAFLAGPPVVNFVAGESYSAAGKVVGWLFLGQIFGGMYMMQTNYIFFSKSTGLLSLVTIFSGVINIGLLFLLVGRFGLLGAAYAFCASMALRFMLTWLVAQKSHPMPWFDSIKMT